MSSDSDSDEFYDAEEATPSRQYCSQYHVTAANNLTEKALTDLSLEEEKERLLEEKRQAEERLQREEEEIQRKLEELERKQKHKDEAEKKRKIEELKRLSDRKAEENELRRMKLIQMRQQMTDDTTPLRDDTSHSTQSVQSYQPNVPTANIESGDFMETVIFNTDECDNSTPVLTGENTMKFDLSISLGDEEMDKIESESTNQASSHLEVRSLSPCERNTDRPMKKWNTINLNLDKTEDKSVVIKDMPDVSLESVHKYDVDVNCDNDLNQQLLDSASQFQKLDVDEPDLIKSTRPKELLGVPKAPPKKKKVPTATLR